MTLEEIKNKTLSTEMTTANAVYRIGYVTFGRNPKKLDQDMYKFNLGDLVAVSGCGELNKKRGETQVFVGDTWYWVNNRALIHYANPILSRVND